MPAGLGADTYNADNPSHTVRRYVVPLDSHVRRRPWNR